MWRTRILADTVVFQVVWATAASIALSLGVWQVMDAVRDREALKELRINSSRWTIAHGNVLMSVGRVVELVLLLAAALVAIAGENGEFRSAGIVVAMLLSVVTTLLVGIALIERSVRRTVIRYGLTQNRRWEDEDRRNCEPDAP